MSKGSKIRKDSLLSLTPLYTLYNGKETLSVRGKNVRMKLCDKVLKYQKEHDLTLNKAGAGLKMEDNEFLQIYEDYHEKVREGLESLKGTFRPYLEKVEGGDRV